jgi:parallel beta-helix repeat protein
MRRWLGLALVGVVVAACGRSTRSDGNDGAGAKGGTGGRAGAGGASGASALGGSGGRAGRGGMAGAGRSATGGAGGGGGRSSGGSPGKGGSDAGSRGAGRGGTAGAGGTAMVAGAAGEEGGSAGVPDAPPGCDNPGWNPDTFDTVYEVGPGLDFDGPGELPWGTMGPGTLVRIHGRTDPYWEKWVINTTGTPDHPVVVLGVPENGKLPVINGASALTSEQLDFWNEDRGVIKIGGANSPSGPAAYITIECLDIQGARPGNYFSATDGTPTEYAEDAACAYIEEGSHITLRNNTLHGCGNGIFASSGSSEVLVAGNYVYDNGVSGSEFEHNSYTEAAGITFEFNHYGPLCSDCDGHNLKDRSAGTVIRYNWIEGGSRELDLVESDHDELINDPRYRQTLVYGNVLVEPDDAGNSQIVHYGGDGGDETKYRKGQLYFFNNTVVSTRAGNTTLFRLSTNGESVTALNNVFSVSVDGNALALAAGAGTFVLDDNWLPTGWVDSHDTFAGLIDPGTNVEGESPGFTDAAAQDFTLLATSACIDKAGVLPQSTSADPLRYEYVKHQSGQGRESDGHLDIGAFER